MPIHIPFHQHYPFCPCMFMFGTFDFYGEIKKWQMLVVDKNVHNDVNLADTDPQKWVSSRRSTLLRGIYLVLYYVWGMCAGIGKNFKSKTKSVLGILPISWEGGYNLPLVVVMGVQIRVVLTG